VNPDLVVRDADREIYTVRYDAVNAMLLTEYLKERRRVQELEANDLARQQEIAALNAELKDQRILIQRVNDKVEVTRSAPQNGCQRARNLRL